MEPKISSDSLRGTEKTSQKTNLMVRTGGEGEACDWVLVMVNSREASLRCDER